MERRAKAGGRATGKGGKGKKGEKGGAERRHKQQKKLQLSAIRPNTQRRSGNFHKRMARIMSVQETRSSSNPNNPLTPHKSTHQQLPVLAQ